MFTLLLDLGKKASEAIKAGVQEFKASPSSTQEAVTSILLVKLKDWEPEYAGKKILTPGLRLKFAVAFAGLAWNIHAVDAKKTLV